jgi:hypothetical protein
MWKNYPQTGMQLHHSDRIVQKNLQNGVYASCLLSEHCFLVLQSGNLHQESCPARRFNTPQIRVSR